MDLSTFKCPVCNNYETQDLDSLRVHGQKKHNISSNSIYIALFTEDKQAPKCACGCGETPKFWSIQRGYAKFIRGHAARVHNNWGHNEAAMAKSLKKRQDEGLWSRDPWNRGKTKESDERVANIGKKKNMVNVTRY